LIRGIIAKPVCESLPTPAELGGMLFFFHPKSFNVFSADFQTKDNLLTGGATFIQGFVATVTKLITTGHF
jgi:hypothetical protein